jgi:hypothetical protein
LTGDGLVGYNVIRYARECLGGALAAQKFASAFYKNNATPGGILQHQETLSENAQNRLRNSMEKQMSGAENASRLLVIEEGMTFTQTTIPPEEAQFLETRQFNVPEICRWFRMPPGKVGDITRAQGWSTLEMTNTDYVTDTLLPWLVRWEQEVGRKLFSPRDKVAGYFAKHVVNGLLRGDVKSRTESYVKGRNWGWLSADDVRELEDMNPLPDGQGEKYLIPLNMRDAAADDNFNATAQQLEEDFNARKAHLITKHNAEKARLKDEHSAKIEQLNADWLGEKEALRAEVEKLAEIHKGLIEAKDEAHQEKINQLGIEHQSMIEQAVAEKNAAIAESNAEKERLGAELAGANAKCAELSEFIAGIKTELETVSVRSEEQDEEIKQFESDLQSIQEKLTTAESVKLLLEKELAESESKNAGLIDENTSIQKDLEAANQTIAGHEEEKAQLEAKIENAKAQAKLWKDRREELNTKLIDDAAERIANVEVEKLKSRISKASDDKEKWQQFVCGFYAKHRKYISRTISHITNKNKDIAKVLAADGIEVFTGKDPESALEKWAVNRSSQIADLLRKELEC